MVQKNSPIIRVSKETWEYLEGIRQRERVRNNRIISLRDSADIMRIELERAKKGKKNSGGRFFDDFNL